MQPDLSFPTRDGTCIPCIGSWILNHWMVKGGNSGCFRDGEQSGRITFFDDPYIPANSKHLITMTTTTIKRELVL